MEGIAGMAGLAGLAELALLLGAGVALLLLCRSGLLWYWRVDERVRLAREQNALLREVRDALRGVAADAAMPPDAPAVPNALPRRPAAVAAAATTADRRPFRPPV